MRIKIEEAAEFLRTHDDYLILMHSNPDGDTLGCGFALCGALQRMGKRAKAVCADPIPRRFDYLCKAIEQQEFEPQTIVAVDVADAKLLTDNEALGLKAELCIDHHGTNREYAVRTLLEPDYAANCELVYQVICELGVTIDKELANCLYTGVATDTGCFKYSNTTPQTHIIAARLIELGAEISYINYIMFEMKTPMRLELEQAALAGLRYYGGGRIAVISVSLALLETMVNVDSEDIGALAAIPRQIEGVDIGISIKEKKPGLFKASLRSSERADAAQIAAVFGGGGHARAAGCSFVDKTQEEVEALLVAECEKALGLA
ncbi:MAG: bifunctional oligoribonuclease/PAP phosphatase NrnA [Oscillospiraceae bacterium]